jgi:type II secretory pathway pseudopilin PulG
VDEGPPPRKKSNAPIIIVIVLVVGGGLVMFVAIIAAIAIPGLLSSQRASNERNAAASLKTLAAAEADFRANDRDANRRIDFWTADVAGLYGLTPADVKGNRDPMIMLIEQSVAAADHAPLPDGAAGGEYAAIDRVTMRAPKAGYRFAALKTNAEDKPYNDGSLRNPLEYGFCSFPDRKASGRSAFIISEGNTIFRLLRADPAPIEAWPEDEELRMNWSKMD